MKIRIRYILLVFIALGFLMALRPAQILLPESNKSDIEITEIKIHPESFLLLPPVINENSGIVYNRGLIWTYNDSGGPDIFYGIYALNN